MYIFSLTPTKQAEMGRNHNVRKGRTEMFCLFLKKSEGFFGNSNMEVPFVPDLPGKLCGAEGVEILWGYDSYGNIDTCICRDRGVSWN